MLVALYHDQRVARHVLGGDEPGLGAAVLLPADAEPLALAEGVVRQALMAAADVAFGCSHVAGVARQVAFEEFAEVALADEADAGAVLLGGVGQADLCVDPTYLGLGQGRRGGRGGGGRRRGRAGGGGARGRGGGGGPEQS